MIFRYPGGKGKLVKKFLQYIPSSMDCFADIFVGGGSVALAVAMRDKDVHLYLNDRDRWIASFWGVIIGEEKDFRCLISLIKSVKISIEEFVSRREKFFPQIFSKRNEASEVDAAFNALFFNRTTFSGCLGSGPIGGYETQEGAEWKVDARWNPERLIKEICAARKLFRGRTEVTNLDFAESIQKLPANCFLYADPPYYNKGNTLYESGFVKEKHKELFSILKERGDWLLSYDNCSEIKKLYAEYNLQTLGKTYRSMRDSSDRPEDESELIIFSKEEKDMKRTKETFIDEKGVERYTDTKKKARTTKALPAKPVDTVRIPESALSVSRKSLFEVLTPEQIRSLAQFGKCEITQTQAQDASK